MSRSNQPIHPTDAETDAMGYGGLTVREHFAAMAMQGLCANPAPGGKPEEDAKWAVKYADALLIELERTK